MDKTSRLGKVMLCQNLGFLAIIGLCYIDDLIRLPALIFQTHPFAFRFQRSTVEMLLILAVWLLVNASTRRILERIRHLEKFLRVCSWCRRIDYKGHWMPLEEFMEQGFDTPTTHGICGDCLKTQQDALERAKRQSKGALAQAKKTS